MNIARGNERNARGLSRTLPAAKLPLSHGSAMQLGHGVSSIRKDFAPLQKLGRVVVGAREQPLREANRLRARRRPRRRGGTLPWEPGDGLESKADKAGHNPSRFIAQSKIGWASTIVISAPIKQFEADLLGSDVSANRTGQAVPIGDRHPGIAQDGRLAQQARSGATPLPGTRSWSCNEARHNGPAASWRAEDPASGPVHRVSRAVVRAC